MSNVASSWGRRHWATVLLAVAVALLVAMALYGLAAPAVFGHYGYHLGEYITRARHTIRSGAILPYNTPGWTLPPRETLYVHHPLLTHYLVVPLIVLFGEREASVRMAAVIAAVGCVFALAALLRRTDGPAWGAAGAVIFAVVPINAWYASHIDPGLPSIFFLLLFFRSYLTFSETRAWRDLGWASLWLVLSANFEWSPYLAVVPVGVHSLYVAARRRGWALAAPPWLVFVMVASLAAHFAVVSGTAHLAEMRASYAQRTSIGDIAVYQRYLRIYCESYFGWPLLVATPLWLLGATVRAVTGRGRGRDLVGVSFLFAVTFYAYLFKDAVLTHGYRLLYGNVVAVIAALGVADDAAAIVRWLVARTERSWTTQWVFGASVCAIVVATLPRTWAGLIESRAHQGIPGWASLNPFIERTAFVRVVQTTTNKTDKLFLHPAFPTGRMEIAFYLDRDQAMNARPSSMTTLSADLRGRAVYLFPVAGLSRFDQTVVDELATRYPYTQVGGFAMLDLRTERADVRRYALVDLGAARPLWRRYLEGPHGWPQLRPLPP